MKGTLKYMHRLYLKAAVYVSARSSRNIQYGVMVRPRRSWAYQGEPGARNGPLYLKLFTTRVLLSALIYLHTPANFIFQNTALTRSKKSSVAPHLPLNSSCQNSHCSLKQTYPPPVLPRPCPTLLQETQCV